MMVGATMGAAAATTAEAAVLVPADVPLDGPSNRKDSLAKSRSNTGETGELTGG